MGKVTIRVGRSGVGKTRQLLEEIREDTSGFRHILICPDQLTHRLERELSEICGDSISMRGEVLSFSRLSRHILHHCGGLEEPELDKGGRLLLLQQSVQKCQDRLEVLGHYTQQGSFYEKLMKTLDELKTNGVATELLFQLDQTLPEEKKIHDIALICGFYDSFTLGVAEGTVLDEKLGTDREKTARVAHDPRDRMTRVADALGDSSWGEEKVFWVDGFTDFTPQQLNILQHLMGQGEGMTLSLTGDLAEMSEVDSLFSPAFLTLKQLEERGKKENVNVEVKELQGDFTLRNPPLSHLEQHLFAETLIPYPEAVAEEVTVFSALTPHSEVEWVASEILRLVREENQRFRDILVVARNFSTYRDSIESVFPRYQIPVFTTEMVSILEKPVISVVNMIFQVINGRFRSEDMLKYLKTGFSSLPLKEVDKVEEYVLMWGEENWRAPWKKHTKRYDGHISEGKLSELSGKEGYDSAKRAYDSNERALKYLNGLRSKAMAPLLLLEEAVDSASGKSQCEFLYACLEELHLYEKIKERQRVLEEEGNLQQSMEYQQLWEILCRALEQSHELFTDEIMDFREFSKMFALVLSQYSVGTIPVSLDQVTAGETTRLKSNRVKTVFWLGCEDSVVPLPSNSGGLLNDTDRMLLQKYEITLNQDSERLLYREMTTAYEICALARERLIFSYPSRNIGGESLRPCFLIPRLEAMYPNLKIKREEELQGHFRLVSPLPAMEQGEKFPFVLDILQENPLWQKEMGKITAGQQCQRGSLSALGLRALYGEKVMMSATALDKLNSCQFAYFMHYGLGARGRRKMAFQGAEYGNLVHHVLETVLRPFAFVSDPDKKKELRGKIPSIDGLIADYMAEELGGNQNPRELFLLKRLGQYVGDVVTEVLEEIQRSDFTYLAGEYHFQQEIPQHTPGEKADFQVVYRGSIDRVDGFLQDGALYFHLVDYKTGTKVMDYAAIYQGRDLQLLLYYLALSQGDRESFQAFCPGNPRESKLAALSYLPGKTESESGKRGSAQRADAPTGRIHVRHTGLFLHDETLIEALETPEQGKFRYVPVSFDKDKNLKSVGESLVTESQLDLLLGCGQKHLSRVAEQIGSGEISANPYYQDEGKNACLYCDYKSACHFEEGKDEARMVKKRSQEWVLEKLSKEAKDGAE